jgi:hypothetical protein
MWCAFLVDMPNTTAVALISKPWLFTNCAEYY